MFNSFAPAEFTLDQFAASSSPRVGAWTHLRKRQFKMLPQLKSASAYSSIATRYPKQGTADFLQHTAPKVQRLFPTTKRVYMRTLVFLSLAFMVFVSGVVGASTPCTESGYQAILDGMISVGGQYLEVFPVNVPQFPTAFAQAQQKFSAIPDAPLGLSVSITHATQAAVQTRSKATEPASSNTTANGIYVVSPNLKTLQTSLPDAIYSNPNINGVMVDGLWNQIEPSPGVFDWSVVDQEITQAVANNKKIAINVTAGAYAPSWLYEAPYNVPHDTFLWGNHDGVNGPCEPYVLPAPWDSQYEQAWASMMSAYAQHLQSIPGAYAATTRVRLTGINTLTDELHLAFCSNSNGLALWQALGYTPDKLLAAAKVLMSATSAAFPDKILSLSIIEAGGLPLINDAGQVVTTSDPSYINVKQLLIDYALSSESGISNRFAVQWNGFQNPATAAASVIAAGQNGAIIGWETNEFGGLTNGAECLN